MYKARLKKDGGMTLILTLIALFFLLIVIYFALYPFGKLTVYSQLQEIGRGAMFKIEADGGLTEKTESLIKNNVREKGLDPSKVVISCSHRVKDEKNFNFGSKIILQINYPYSYEEKKIVGFRISSEVEKTELITVRLVTTSKN